ncbi:MAG: 4Fe-4S dicluster domain-containing protein [Candidatus Bathyarchaeia archaeon]
MAQKILAVHPERCTGCEKCVLWCSFIKSKVFNPARSRIHVIRSEPYVDIPMICIQCGLCMDACPIKAMNRNPKTNAVVIDEEKCTSCGRCVTACPYGVLTLDPVTGKAIKCDLCGGDPECVKHCPKKVLYYVEPNKAAYLRRLMEYGGAISIGRKEPIGPPERL